MANIFHAAKKAWLEGTLDMTSGGDTIRVLLFTTSPAALDGTTAELLTVAAVLGDAAFTEAADGSYTGQGVSGRLTVTMGASATIDSANDWAELDGNDATWTGLDNMTLTGAMVYKFVTDDSGSTPIAFYDFSSDLTCNGGDVTVSWSDDGLVTIA